MKLHDAPARREPQTQPALRAPVRQIAPNPERLQKRRDLALLQNAVVADREARHAIRLAREVEAQLVAPVADRVHDEPGQRHLQHRPVGAERDGRLRQRGHDRLATLHRRRARRGREVAHQCTGVEIRLVELPLARREVAVVEDALENIAQRLARPRDRGEDRRLRIGVDPALQDARIA
ncbi:hypothetical protein P8627_13040 [Jannaschia sp. GRR-S6-38]|uniref:Uncharacterized protein n=1 Tax=Jannaschia ovalis TaxID=3038773 RepID=A0ABY8L9B6_9RHOB|nr:hypothetical protein [Jannaschia sp. GRR-S6-38]WGH77950.1 hypothetical protein P8627_13040 [Jannaschia sp. GRR-S6-38]